MNKRSYRKRLLSLLMSVVMALSLIPTAAFAVDDESPPAANAEGRYTVTFRQNAATRTEVAVTPVDSSGASLSITSNVTLDSVTFDMEQVEDETVYIDSLVSGYGLLTVTAGGKDYYFDHASWGASGDPVEIISYGDVTKNTSKGLYFHYTTESEQKIEVQLVSETGAAAEESTIGEGQVTSGRISSEKAQAALEAQQEGTYAYI